MHNVLLNGARCYMRPPELDAGKSLSSPHKDHQARQSDARRDVYVESNNIASIRVSLRQIACDAKQLSQMTNRVNIIEKRSDELPSPSLISTCQKRPASIGEHRSRISCHLRL